ncbi:MAG: 30S ribosomal protein S17 [Candidatus Aenigmarchaeota archaeon]|nr:30S ribosomal protein S17 [Candidatus Aenigmarchaeota archaeon]
MVKKSIGIEAKRPKKECTDPKCPWHGKLSLRGRVFIGTVTSSAATQSAVVRWDYNYFLKKYQVYERRHSRVVAHNPECISAKEGDRVKIMECRPISKTKSFAIVEVLQ